MHIAICTVSFPVASSDVERFHRHIATYIQIFWSLCLRNLTRPASDLVNRVGYSKNKTYLALMVNIASQIPSGVPHTYRALYCNHSYFSAIANINAVVHKTLSTSSIAIYISMQMTH